MSLSDDAMSECILLLQDTVHRLCAYDLTPHDCSGYIALVWSFLCENEALLVRHKDSTGGHFEYENEDGSYKILADECPIVRNGVHLAGCFDGSSWLTNKVADYLEENLLVPMVNIMLQSQGKEIELKY